MAARGRIKFIAPVVIEAVPPNGVGTIIAKANPSAIAGSERSHFSCADGDSIRPVRSEIRSVVADLPEGIAEWIAATITIRPSAHDAATADRRESQRLSRIRHDSASSLK